MGQVYGAPAKPYLFPPEVDSNSAVQQQIDLLRVPLSLSILVDSPLRTDLALSPVAAFFIPLVESNLFLGSLIIGALDLFIAFLMKLQLVCPPTIKPPSRNSTQVTLSMAQLTRLIAAYSRGMPLDPYLKPGENTGPFGGDEPLFPDNLSVSLMLSAPFADFDGSPDTSLNVPLFEVPGLQGGLIIALLIVLGRFIIEEGGVGCASDNRALIDPQSMLRYLMSLKGNGR